MSVANPEEAAHIANEFISSIENIHLEFQFLLGEIKRKDAEVIELEAKIHKKTLDVFGRKATGPITPKDQSNIDKAREYLDKIDKLADDKVRLATRLERIATKVVGHLDYDLVRIRKASGDVPLVEPPAVAPFRPPQAPQAPVFPQAPVQIAEAVVSAPSPVPSGSSNKRRRLNATASVLAGINNAPVTLTHVSSSRSRHPPQQVQAQAPTPSPAPSRRREATKIILEDEADPEDEMEEDAKADEDDNAPYCYCQKPSYGEMIACDGRNCPYDWFHLSCLGLKSPPKGQWFCSECSVTYGDRGSNAPQEKGRKGRR